MSEKKKILIFIDWFLPGYKAGGPIRSIANMIDSLHEIFDFNIITSDRDLRDQLPYPKIKTNEWIIKDKYSIIYLSPDKQIKQQYIKLVDELSFHKVYFNSLFSYRFTILPLRIISKKNDRKKIILAPRGMLGKGALEIKKTKKKLFLFYSKFMGLYSNILWHATSTEEKNDILKTFGKKTKIIISDNIPQKIKTLKKKEKGKETRFYFISRISKKKNLKYAITLFSNLKVKSKTIFDIYGPIEDENYWDNCKQLFNNQNDKLTLNYMGELEHKMINNIIPNYHFLIFPSFHENYGHVIYEALSFGCPIIISDQTPWKNLEEKGVGWDISLRNKDKFKAIIQTCIDMDQTEYNRLSENAFNFAQNYADQNDLINKTIKLFE